MVEDMEIRSLAEFLIEELRARQLTLALAESCTGGLAGAYITAIPGSSDVFDRGFITYSNEAKNELLGLPDEIIEEHGAVSAETAISMAFGALAQSGAGLAASITGIAGPGGGSKEKPVGLVYIAVAAQDSEEVYVEELQFGDLAREEIREKTVRATFEMLLSLGFSDDSDDMDFGKEADSGNNTIH